ncbi:MAG: hypothetical protein K0S45_3301 [Nitrospira sp.]|nr:hypothetical protein [Nitrospira sp.]
MVAFVFLLPGIFILPLAAGCIWVDATPLGSHIIDSAAANCHGESGPLSHMTEVMTQCSSHGCERRISDERCIGTQAYSLRADPNP